MKIKIMAVMIGLALIATSSFAADGDLIVNGKLGVGTTAPAAKVDVNGEIKIGNTGLACSSTTAGATRYNSGRLEYCNGTIWGPVNDNTVVPSVPGDILESHNAAGRSTSSTSMTKLKQTTITRPGTYRISFVAIGNIVNCVEDSSSYGVYAQIYRNGSPVGTLRYSPPTGGITFSEDISGWNIGDKVELYARLHNHYNEMAWHWLICGVQTIVSDLKLYTGNPIINTFGDY